MDWPHVSSTKSMKGLMRNRLVHNTLVHDPFFRDALQHHLHLLITSNMLIWYQPIILSQRLNITTTIAPKTYIHWYLYKLNLRVDLCKPKFCSWTCCPPCPRGVTSDWVTSGHLKQLFGLVQAASPAQQGDFDHTRKWPVTRKTWDTQPPAACSLCELCMTHALPLPFPNFTYFYLFEY